MGGKPSFLPGAVHFASPHCRNVTAPLHAPPHPSRLTPCHLPLEGKALPPRLSGSAAANSKLSPPASFSLSHTQKVPRRASSAGDFTSDSALIQLKALKAVFTWPWGRQPRCRRAYWGTSWRSSPGTWRPACWPARRKQPYPPTCRGHPASRRARRGSWWDNPR